MPERPLVVTPDYLRNRARELHTELNRQAAFVSVFSPREREQWYALRDRWVRWYSDANYLWGATASTLDDFATSIKLYADLISSRDASGRPVVPVEPTSSPLGLGTVLVGLGMLWLLFGNKGE